MDIFSFTAMISLLCEQAPGARVKTAGGLASEGYFLELACVAGRSLFSFSVAPSAPAVAFERIESAATFHHEDKPGGFGGALSSHLKGSVVTGVHQPEGERMVEISFERKGDFGKSTVRRLVIEIMGRHSGAFILSDVGVALAIARKVRQEDNRFRRILQGKPLPSPPPLAKASPMTITESDWSALAESAQQAKGAAKFSALLCSWLSGVTRQAAGKILEMAGIPEDADIGDTGQMPSRMRSIFQVFETLRTRDGAATLRNAADAYELGRILGDEIRNPAREAKSGDKAATPGNERLFGLQSELEKVGAWEDVLRLGERILSECPPGSKMRWNTAGKIGDEILRQAEVSGLTELLSPSIERNEELHPAGVDLIKLAGRYRKALPRLEARIRALETGEESSPRAKRQDSAEKDAQVEKREVSALKALGIKHKLYYSGDGIPIVVGGSATSNDALLRKYRSTDYWWFHAREFAGSWVIALSGQNPLAERTRIEAAVIAAWHSKARGDTTAEVCFTQMKYLRKPKGAPPGRVLVVNEKTITVRPAEFTAIQERQG